jgi:hypothetical protein
VTFSPAFRFAPAAANITVTIGSLPFADIGQVGVLSVSTTGFTINTRAAPGAGGLILYWSARLFP